MACFICELVQSGLVFYLGTWNAKKDLYMHLKSIFALLLLLAVGYIYLSYEPELTIDTTSMNSFAWSEYDIYLSLEEHEKPIFIEAIRFYSYGGDYISYSEFIAAVLARGENPQDIKFHENAERINGMTGKEVITVYQDVLHARNLMDR